MLPLLKLPVESCARIWRRNDPKPRHSYQLSVWGLRAYLSQRALWLFMTAALSLALVGASQAATNASKTANPTANPKSDRITVGTLPDAEVARIVSAIWRLEGGDKTRHPYGVLSVKVASKEEARKVTERSVRNNWARWQAAGAPGEFCDFMAARWVPVASDPQGNANWRRNFRAIVGKINN